jgi:hypothetical protein
MAKRVANPPAASIEFAFEKYRLDRLHELELNKATHNFEQESLKILSYLNGGAAAAYIGLLGKSVVVAQPIASVAAVGSWAIGLLMASSALLSAYKAQVRFAQAYHKRRRAEEKRRFAGDVTRALVTDRSKTDKDYDLLAEPDVAEGKLLVDRAKHTGFRSILFFCVGLGFALYSVFPA